MYRPLKIVKKEVVVSGYKVYYCPNYLLTNSSLLKTLVVPCGCGCSNCEHKITCTLLQPNPEGPTFQLEQIDRQLTGLRNPMCFGQQIDGAYLVVLKSMS